MSYSGNSVKMASGIVLRAREQTTKRTKDKPLRSGARVQCTFT